MATHTLATSVALTCVTFSPSTTVLSPTDLASVAQMVRDDINVAHPPISGGACSHRGLLCIPNRLAHLAVLPGDVIAVDGNGWPILVSAHSIAAGGWTFT
jgi:hypothetical protein